MKYKKKLAELLSGKALGVPRDRVGWAGYMAAHGLYEQTTQGDRSALVDAMLDLIQDASTAPNEENWLLAADVIHLAYSVGLRDERIDHLVRRLASVTAPNEQCRDAMHYASASYLQIPEEAEIAGDDGFSKLPEKNGRAGEPGEHTRDSPEDEKRD